MEIKKKLLIALGILSVFVAITGILGILYTLSINEKLLVVTTQTNPTVESVDDLIIIIWKNAKTVEEFSTATSRDELAGLEKEFESTHSDFIQLREIAYNLIADPVLREKLDDAVQKYTLFVEKSYEILYLGQENLGAKSANTEEVMTELTRQAAKSADEAANVLEEISLRVYAKNKVANEESFTAVRTTERTLVLTTILSIICAIAIGVYLSRTIIAPINRLADAASQISRGDFGVTVEEPKRDDEITHLITIFNNMVVSLGKMIKRSPDLKRYLNLEQPRQETPEYIMEPGTAYLLKGASSSTAYEIAAEKSKKGFRTICFGREHPDTIRERYDLAKARYVWLKEGKERLHETTTSLPAISKIIADIVAKPEPAIILVDRIDYLMTLYTFADVLKFVTHLNDMIMTSKATLVIPLDPALMNERNLSFIEKELKELSFTASQKQELSDDVKNILSFIKNRAVMGKATSFKDVSKECNITAPTTQKKLLELEHKGHIRVSKQGRNKVLYPL